MSESKICSLEILEYPNSVMADLINDTESILKGFQEYDDIISEYKFKNIKIYGDNNNPCFQANCIFDYLYPKYMKNFDNLTDEMKTRTKRNRKRQFTRWVSDNFEYEISNNITDEIYKASIKNNSSDKRYYECYVLTETGMLTAMCSNKTELSRVFKKRLMQFIKNIRDHHITIYNEERINSNNILKKELELERGLRKELQSINNCNIQLQEAFHNPSEFGDHEKTELTILRRETQKQYYLYIVDWSYINSKFWKSNKSKNKSIKEINKASKEIYQGIDFSSDNDDITDNKIIERKLTKKNNEKNTYDESEPHKNGIQDPYELFNVSLYDLINNNNQDYYFCIKPKEITSKKKDYFKFISYINIKNNIHYKAMIEIINNGNKYNYSTSYPINSETVNNDRSKSESNFNFADEISTPEAGVFIQSYSDIIDARNSSFINLNKNYLKNGSLKQ